MNLMQIPRSTHLDTRDVQGSQQGLAFLSGAPIHNRVYKWWNQGERGSRVNGILVHQTWRRSGKKTAALITISTLRDPHITDKTLDDSWILPQTIGDPARLQEWTSL